MRTQLTITAIVLAVAVTGCSKPPEYPSITVGECVGSMTEGVVIQVEKVPCNKPHDWEAFADKTLADTEEFPGTEKLDEETERFCSEEFATFVGIDLAESKLEVQYLIPTKLSWDVGDRKIVCMAGAEDLQVSGTLKGSKG